MVSVRQETPYHSEFQPKLLTKTTDHLKKITGNWYCIHYIREKINGASAEISNSEKGFKNPK